MIAFRYCLRTDCESYFAQCFCFTTISGGVIGSRFRHYADCQRIFAFRLGIIRHGDSSRSLRFRCLSDSYAPAAGRLRFRTDSDITGSCCTSLFADSNAAVFFCAIILVVRACTGCRAVDGEIMNWVEVINPFAQVGNALVICDINRASVDTVLNCLSVSCDGESFIRCSYVKGNSFAVFDVLRCGITFCLQLP